MANLYVTEQGSHIRKTGDRIIVEKDTETLLDLPCSKIDSVLIFGNVQFTTQMVHELFEHGIEMALLEGMNVSVISVPDGKDPADCVKNNPEVWKKAAEKTIKVMDFHFESVLDHYHLMVLSIMDIFYHLPNYLIHQFLF